MSNSQWHDDQSIGERALRDHKRRMERIEDLVRELAEDDCSYGDNCPSNARHYRCIRCKAVAALEGK